MTGRRADGRLIGPHCLLPSKLPRCDGVYLICFDAPVSSANGRRVTRHYIGWAANIRRRVEHHRAGVSGSRFMAYVNAAGVGWTVARLWLCATRADERALKNWHKAAQLCPRCNPALAACAADRLPATCEK